MQNNTVMSDMPQLDAHYWENRYRQQQTGWDVGAVTPPLKAYIDQLSNRNLRILIPGAGNSYEAEYLWQQGFKHVTVCDLAAQPLANIRKRVPDFPLNQLIEGDFFNLPSMPSYDLILEQTFFCALRPNMRKQYAAQMAHLLRSGGKLVGLLFSDCFLGVNEPPFGGTQAEYQALFEPYFHIETLAPCYNSLAPRAGRELFICMTRK